MNLSCFHLHNDQLVEIPECAPSINIYILSAVALDETNISSCWHFSMQNIEISCDLDCTSRLSNGGVGWKVIK